MLTKRLEILFEPKEFETIKQKALAEGKSVAKLIRETLREKLIDRDINEKEQALKRLFSLKPESPFSEWDLEKERITKERVKEIETA